MAEDFEFKPFEEMTPEDYERIGFKSGLEVHQQLHTEKKLFCRCPAGRYSKEYHAEILRHMRPTLSEMGEYDGTALMEFKTKKDIIYRINRNTVCTYEMDDTPPFTMNEQALDIAIEIGMLTNSSLVDEIHIARKQYLDGSIPTGFQRTAIVSVGGWLPYKDRKINIIQMSIEEDSCRELSDVGHKRVYIADRLGMPLIEMVTFPEMKTPQEVAEVNNIIRRLNRSSGKVRVGGGAAREDVNVSVRGGTRIEIKGVHSIKKIPLLTYNEAMRQWNLLKLKDVLNSRGINEETFEYKIDDVTQYLRKTMYQPIAGAIQDGMVVKCVTLRKCRGALRWKTQTDTTFAKEVSDRVRVIACLTTLPNITHSDYPGETIASAEGKKIRKSVGANEEDALVLVWGSEKDTETGAEEIAIRLKEAATGIPSETRQALRDGTNGFERILPGPERMYPDTDLPPIKITPERVERIRLQAPKQIWEREGKYRKLGVPPGLIKDLATSQLAPVFSKAVDDWNISPVFTSTAIVNYVKRLKKQGYDIDILSPEIMMKIFESLKNGRIIKECVYPAMEMIVKEGDFNRAFFKKPATEEELKLGAKKAAKAVEKINLYDDKNRNTLIMAELMRIMRGRIDGEKAWNYINNEFGEGQ